MPEHAVSCKRTLPAVFGPDHPVRYDLSCSCGWTLTVWSKLEKADRKREHLQKNKPPTSINTDNAESPP